MHDLKAQREKIEAKAEAGADRESESKAKVADAAQAGKLPAWPKVSRRRRRHAAF